MYLRAFCFLLLLAFSAASSANTLKAQLSGDSARFRYNAAGMGQAIGNMEMEFGFLYTDKDTPHNDYLLDAGVLVRGESLEAPLIVSIGARAYAGKASDYDVYAVSIGGDAMFLPEAWKGFGIGAYIFAAPGVVSFGDADGLMEYGMFLNFEITPQANILLGYQKIEVEIETNNVGDVEIDKGAFFGIEIKF